MNNVRNRPVVRSAPPWRLALGVAAGAVGAAAMLGLFEAGDAHADSGSDVLGQAGMDLTQATTLLDGAPTAALDAQETTFLTGQEMLQSDNAAGILSMQESFLSSLPAADQPDLTVADTQLADAFQGILTADQTFVAADQAGDLTGFTPFTDELGIIGADFSVIPADFNIAVADVGADFASMFSGMDFLSF